MDSPIPKLRTDLEIMPTTYQGRQAYIIRDFLGLIQKPLLLEGDALNLLSLADGKRTVRDIQLLLMRRGGGVFISAESIQNQFAELDRVHLLDSDRYRGQKKQLADSYAKLKVRAAAHAGQSFPDSKKDLERFLDSILELGEDGPEKKDGEAVCALAAPHIDFGVGGKIYGQAYRALRHLQPQKIIVLGTGHSLESGYFSLTEKDFETPLGRTRTDKASVEALRYAGARAVAPDDLAHRREHSIEFQVIFLQRLFGTDFVLIPILCGSFTAKLFRVSRASKIPGVGDFLRALTGIIAENGDRLLIVAGIDFSHIGPKFGHRRPAASMLLEAKRHDQALIEACAKGDAEALWAESKRVRDEYNVCGFSSLACLLEVLPSARGVLLGYDFWQEPETQSAVSFAAIQFVKKS
jgi:AmmeMemoRadiSam system protein B